MTLAGLLQQTLAIMGSGSEVSPERDRPCTIQAKKKTMPLLMQKAKVAMTLLLQHKSTEQDKADCCCRPHSVSC